MGLVTENLIFLFGNFRRFAFSRNPKLDSKCVLLCQVTVQIDSSVSDLTSLQHFARRLKQNVSLLWDFVNCDIS
jgi:hypothetical protein